ncbi:sigma-70 family RNA polymerase sigma factor [Actinomadura welshii]
MDQDERLADRFEAHRAHLRTVAYGILGSISEAEDAVQETWVRLSRTDVSTVENLGGWLTTVVARVCLDMLRRRSMRREEPIGLSVPEPIVSSAAGGAPEEEALMADSVGLALMVVLHTLAPAERLAYVLHDIFGVPYQDISPIVGRSPAAARQLASRARRRVQESAPAPDPDLARQRELVDAFFAAAHAGDFEALVAVLDPAVVLHADHDPAAAVPGVPVKVTGARNVAERALTFSRFARFTRPVLVNGHVGVVVEPHGRPFSVIGFTVREGRIVEIDVFAEPERLRRIGVVTSIRTGGGPGQMSWCP